MAVFSVQMVDPLWLNQFPADFREYFLNNMPGGCSSDMKLTVISNMGRLWQVLVKPVKQYGWKKFCDFLLDSWDYKTIIELPGIGDIYAARLQLVLGNYCSVRQLYSMFLCWGVVKFSNFLNWACQAEISNSGPSHIDRTVAAIEQKHRLSHNLPVYLIDPNPDLPDK